MVKEVQRDWKLQRDWRIAALSIVCDRAYEFRIGGDTAFADFTAQRNKARKPRLFLSAENRARRWVIRAQDHHRFADRIFEIADTVKNLEEASDSDPKAEWQLGKIQEGLSRTYLVTVDTYPVGLIMPDGKENNLFRELSALLTPKLFLELSLYGDKFPLSVFELERLQQFPTETAFGSKLLNMAEQAYVAMENLLDAHYEAQNYTDPWDSAAKSFDTRLSEALADKIKELTHELRIELPFSVPSYAVRLLDEQGRVIVDELIKPDQAVTRKERFYARAPE